MTSDRKAKPANGSENTYFSALCVVVFVSKLRVPPGPLDMPMQFIRESRVVDMYTVCILNTFLFIKWNKCLNIFSFLSVHSNSMSGAVKRRSAAPKGPPKGPPPPDDVNNGRLDKKGVSSNGSSAPSHSLSYPAEASDDVNMNEVDGIVTLNVTLPSGEQTDINVDYK